MPLVAGGSLKGRVAGPVPPALAVTWLSAIASALDHAHAKGILHRDVKPGNVLMDSQGRPLLADFGLARSAEVSSGLTATGTVLGTPLYMAPEQATGAALSGRADQYALAVIAFELLAGRVPFSARFASRGPSPARHGAAAAALVGPSRHLSRGGRGARPRPLEGARRPVLFVRRLRRRARSGARRHRRRDDRAAGRGRRVAGPDGHLRPGDRRRGARGAGLGGEEAERRRSRTRRSGAKVVLAALLLLSAGGGTLPAPSPCAAESAAAEPRRGGAHDGCRATHRPAFLRV